MRLWNLGACVLALLLASCGGESVTVDQREMGMLQLPMTSSTSSGTTYVLKGASFTITGPQTVTVSGDVPGATVQQPLMAGDYTIQLGDGWHLEDMAVPGTSVSAQLVSPNPLPFSVSKGDTTVVRFQFKLPGQGSADVGISVDSGGWFAGTIQFDRREYTGGPPSDYDGLVGKSVPFVISFDTAMYTKNDSYGKSLRVDSGPITVQFGGAPNELLARAAASMKGAQFSFELYADPSAGGALYLGNLYMYGGSSSSPYRLEFGPAAPFSGALDSEGYPAARRFETSLYDVYLRDPSGYDGVRGPANVNGSP